MMDGASALGSRYARAQRQSAVELLQQSQIRAQAIFAAQARTSPQDAFIYQYVFYYFGVSMFRVWGNTKSSAQSAMELLQQSWWG